jgi:DNA-binding NtrC family response regulator
MSVTRTFNDLCIKMQTKHRILLIDDQWGRADDPMIPGRYGQLQSFEWLLESAEESAGVYSSKKALKRIRKEQPAVVLLDIMFGGEQSRLGVEILENIRSEFPELPVIIFTSLESEENRELVVRCMEIGANEYLEKTPDATQMEAVLKVYTDGKSDHAIYGNSQAIRRLRADIARAAFSGKTSILISGESGTGKELVAMALHRQGPRRDGPMEAYNCADQDSQLLESELFGHKRGAFTGATEDRVGRLKLADRGVLFLDEVASMPLRLQGKLLRALETRTFRRLGGNENISSNFQLVCAINQPAKQLLKEKKLRGDFYYRIAAFTLDVPSLRDHRDDIPTLAKMFLRKFKEDKDYAAYPGGHFSNDSLQQMQSCDWPGNVRELKNAVEGSLIRSTEESIHFTNPYAAASQSDQPTANRESDTLPVDTSTWERERLLYEIRFALRAKKRVQSYKGGQWKAEFMRLMYPECKAANAKGFDDLIKRLTQGPWGSPELKKDIEIKRLLDELTTR